MSGNRQIEFDYAALLEKCGGKPLHDRPSSHLLLDGDVLVKFCRPLRFPQDYLRRYLGSSYASRETSGYARLKRLGLRTPETFAHRVFYHPANPFESALAMEYLAGKVTAHIHLSALPPPQKAPFVQLIANDIRRMVDANIFFKDLQLTNVMAGPDGLPYWIDPEMQVMTNRRRCLLATANRMQRLVRKAKEILDSQSIAALETTVFGDDPEFHSILSRTPQS
jgi:tRNA A-37 threonylcarbamoyl transferase component Bud32